VAVLDHIVVNVGDLKRSKAFYGEALAALGHELLIEYPGTAGFGSDRKPEFWIRAAESAHEPVHIAFAAPDRATVDAFHEAALKAGATDNGRPGIREIYHPSYYGAFVLDPDGHNVEAVCHRPAG
jgi:catechol 2,3-dioxygenase-like lactoylglutathione lyase family enzyme